MTITALHMLRLGGLSLALASAVPPSSALEPVPADLPALPDAAASANPYRGNPQVLSAGAKAYEQHCARCHGAEDNMATPEGPDLRRLNSFCRRLEDQSLVPRCLGDVDQYFLLSVREGKRRAGLMHMPAWKTVLPPELIWAIRSYTETRTLPPLRTLPDLPPVPRDNSHEREGAAGR